MEEWRFSFCNRGQISDRTLFRNQHVSFAAHTIVVSKNIAGPTGIGQHKIIIAFIIKISRVAYTQIKTNTTGMSKIIQDRNSFLFNYIM